MALVFPLSCGGMFDVKTCLFPRAIMLCRFGRSKSNGMGISRTSKIGSAVAPAPFRWGFAYALKRDRPHIGYHAEFCSLAVG